MVNVIKYLSSSQYRNQIDKSIKPLKEFSGRGQSYSYELNRQTTPSKEEQLQKKGGIISTKDRIVNIRKFKVLYKTHGIAYQGINIRNNEVVSRGFELKIKGEENERALQGLKLIQDFVDRNGLRWQSTRQLGINTDICGDGFFELFKDESDFKWKIALLDPETIDFARDRNEKIIIERDVLSPNYGYPIGYVFIEDPNIKRTKTPIDRQRIIHLIYNKIGGEMIGTSILQPGYKNFEMVMNMEEGFGEGGYRTGYPQRGIKVGKLEDKEHPVTEQRMKDAENIAKDLSTNDIITHAHWFEIYNIPTQQIDPSNTINYFLNNEIALFGIPKYQLLGTAAGEGNRAVAETMAKDRASMTNTMQLSIKDCYENQMFRRTLDAEGFTDVTIEMVWNPIIEEDKDSEIANILSLKREGIITVLEARALLSDFIGIIKGDISGLPPQIPQQNPSPFFNSIRQITLQLKDFNEKKNIENNKIVNFDFQRAADERAQFMNSLNQFYEDMRKRLVAKFDESKSIIEENIAIDGIKQIIQNHLINIWKLGYSQGTGKVGNIRKKKLQEGVPSDAMARIIAYATTLSLKESSDLINAVNIQITLGLSGGEGITGIKKRIADAFEKFGGTTGRFKDIDTRAELIARTETQKIVNEARLESYRDAGIEKYEWLATLDDRTEQECLALNGRIFSTSDPTAPHPITGTHPNCRCTIVPII